MTTIILTVPSRRARRAATVLICLALLAAGCRANAPNPSPTPPPVAVPSQTPETGIAASPPASATVVPPATVPVATPAPNNTAPATLAPGWTRVEPGGDTACARGTPYSFWARPGAADKLMIFFQGGGGCWDAATCAPGSPLFDDAVSASDSPDRQRGVFDLDNPDNPFKDWSMVFVAYCTGDVHWGSHVQQYPRAEGGTLETRHTGFINASAALEWTYAHFAQPATVFVTGCSAGSVGSAALVPYISQHYAGATVSQLGDSLAFVYDRPVDIQTNYRAHDNFPSWIPALAGIKPGEFTMARYYAALAQAYPNQHFAQYNTARDAIQEQFYVAVGGQPGEFPARLAAALDEIHAAAPNFRSYTAPGSQHCILPVDGFYATTVNGTRFRDWAAALAVGQDVEDVRCAECEG